MTPEHAKDQLTRLSVLLRGMVALREANLEGRAFPGEAILVSAAKVATLVYPDQDFRADPVCIMYGDRGGTEVARSFVPLSLFYGISPPYAEPTWWVRAFDTATQDFVNLDFHGLGGAGVEPELVELRQKHATLTKAYDALNVDYDNLNSVAAALVMRVKKNGEDIAKIKVVSETAATRYQQIAETSTTIATEALAVLEGRDPTSKQHRELLDAFQTTSTRLGEALAAVAAVVQQAKPASAGGSQMEVPASVVDLCERAWVGNEKAEQPDA